jgi:hypothetical protein
VAGLCCAFDDTTKREGCILVLEQVAWHGQIRAIRSFGTVALKQHKHILANKLSANYGVYLKRRNLVLLVIRQVKM